eukprot:COSAG06_NODE_7274_length_2563_cov_3.062500_3_plen_68_part_00
MGIATAQRLCAIDALGDPTLREMADHVVVCKLLRENPSHATLRERAHGLPVASRVVVLWPRVSVGKA